MTRLRLTTKKLQILIKVYSVLDNKLWLNATLCIMHNKDQTKRPLLHVDMYVHTNLFARIPIHMCAYMYARIVCLTKRIESSS